MSLARMNPDPWKKVFDSRTSHGCSAAQPSEEGDDEATIPKRGEALAGTWARRGMMTRPEPGWDTSSVARPLGLAPASAALESCVDGLLRVRATRAARVSTPLGETARLWAREWGHHPKLCRPCRRVSAQGGVGTEPGKT